MSFAIPVVILVLVLMIAKGPSSSYLKLASFECGFEALTSTRVPFSIKYFLIILLFLVFDVEVVLILPLVSLLGPGLVPGALAGWIILCILFAGLGLEALQGSLQWAE